MIFEKSGYDGRKIAAGLERRKIFAELAGKNEILFMASSATKKRDIKRLYKALLSAIKENKASPLTENKENRAQKVRVMPYLKAAFAEYELTPIKSARGKICAENFGTIPPCRPLYAAGELIDADISEELETGETFGVYEGKVKTVKVK